MKIYRKRITLVDVPLLDKNGVNCYTNTKDIISTVKNDLTLKDTLVSDTFFVEDDNGIILDKEKIIYDGIGHTFVYAKL